MYSKVDEINRDNNVSAEICVDDDNLTLTLFFKKLLSPYPRVEAISFDMKNGIISFEPNRLGGEEKLPPHMQHQKILRILRNLETVMLPQNLLFDAYKKLSALAQKFTGLKNTPTASDLSGKNVNPQYLSEMYVLTMLPYEPKLYGVLMSRELYDLKFRFKYRRDDSEVLNSFINKAHIKSYRTLRKTYSVRPNVLLAYMRLYDCGFSDINLYNRVFENKENCDLINNLNRVALVFFSRFSIEQRGQFATMNMLLKNGDVGFYIKDESVQMFHKNFHLVPQILRQNILKDGFSQFNHDALIKISYQAKK